MGMADADSEEHGSSSQNLIVTACSLPQREPGAAYVDRREAVHLKPGSQAARVFGRESITEEYLCNYEFNREYQERVDAAGLKVVGFDERGVGRIVELPEHRFFMATLFLPQLTSSDARPHPYLVAFVEAASHYKPKTSSARIG
jgi:CTP synthase (UTP-ammonia lyase)